MTVESLTLRLRCYGLVACYIVPILLQHAHTAAIYDQPIGTSYGAYSSTGTWLCALRAQNCVTAIFGKSRRASLQPAAVANYDPADHSLEQAVT